jgi:hypothetical protein
LNSHQVVYWLVPLAVPFLPFYHEPVACHACGLENYWKTFIQESEYRESISDQDSIFYSDNRQHPSR